MTKKEFMEQQTGYLSDKARFLVNFCNENGLEDYVSDIIDTDTLDDMTVREAEKYGFERVYHFVSGIEYLNDEYYYIDAYGNARNLADSDVDWIFDEVLKDEDFEWDEEWEEESEQELEEDMDEDLEDIMKAISEED